jgi:hypothetical protein
MCISGGATPHIKTKAQSNGNVKQAFCKFRIKMIANQAGSNPRDMPMGINIEVQMVNIILLLL